MLERLLSVKFRELAMHGHVGLLTDTEMEVLRMNCPLNKLCHLTYDYQFLKHFPPILDDLHSKFPPGEGGGHTPSSPR